jgi:hypothetical protein
MWPEPTAPAGRRLPSAPRERKPALAALAVLLIVGGAALAGLLVVKSGHRVAAIEISQQVGAGQQIPLSAMHQVQISSDSGVNYVSWIYASQVTQLYAATTIPAGTLLTNRMVVKASNVTAGKDVLGLALKAGQLPGGLAVGDHVNIYMVGSASSSGCPGTPGTALTMDATVLAAVASSSTSGTGAVNVTIALDPGNAGAVACNASAGNVGVVVLPASGQPGAAQSAGGQPTQPAAQITPSITQSGGRNAGTSPTPTVRAS